MNGTILVYGNDAMLVRTRSLILEKADYRVFAAQAFPNAMLMLMNHQIDIIVLCQSLKDEERRGILETARALQPEIKCAVVDFEGREAPIEGVALIEGLVGPSTLLNTIGSILTQKASVQNQPN
jgi:DNA-binding response OmpR family regulator